MLAAIKRRLPLFDVVAFKTALEINDWLTDNLSAVVLIGLDHDLIPSLQMNRTWGQDVMSQIISQHEAPSVT